MKCDSVTGSCLLPDPASSAAATSQPLHADLAVHYIGDPMCSWCWGISPALQELAAFCEAENIRFSMTMGGLRAGGGDPWNAAFREFLRNEWRHIAHVTGQPFGFQLLDLPHFDYDTEPACRAVTAVQLLQARHQLPGRLALKFLSAVQRKFYVEAQDPKVTAFYDSICAGLGLDASEFRALFESDQARQAVGQAFAQCRRWGVRSFPTLLLERQGERQPLAVGAFKVEQIVDTLKQALAA